ncbi:MAG: spore germination protein GerW family protein [Candidatus Cloacimonas sp.]|nr:spore germination protein GerW family protein [Candidatus Cloacimonas sp.]
MNLNQLFAQIRSLVSNAVGVEMAFGQPSKVNDIHIIPVARVSFGFGGGGGSSAAKAKKSEPASMPIVEDIPQDGTENPVSEKQEDANLGGGGGGGMRTEPIGIYSIKGDVIKFHPVISLKEIIAIFALVSVFVLRMSKQRINRKVKK